MRIVDQVRERDAAVRQALFPTDEVLADERSIGSRDRVRVQRIDLAELRAELAGLQQQAGGQRRERDVALFELRPLRPGGDKEIGACVRIDDGLKRRLRFAQLHGRLAAELVLAGDADEVADDRDVRVEHLRRLRRGGRRLRGIGRRLRRGRLAAAGDCADGGTCVRGTCAVLRVPCTVVPVVPVNGPPPIWFSRASSASRRSSYWRRTASNSRRNRSSSSRSVCARRGLGRRGRRRGRDRSTGALRQHGRWTEQSAE